MKHLLTPLLLAASLTLAHAGTPSAKAVTTPPPPGCEDMSYSYLEAGWLHLDDKGIGTSDGGYIDLNYDVGHNLFVDATANVLSGDFDYREFGAGVGAYLPRTKRFHFVARTGWAYADTNLGSGVNEWYVSPGFRLQVTCNLELYAKAYLHVPEVGDTNWSGGVGALYWLCPKAALTVGGAWGEHDEWSIQTGIRLKL